MAELMNRTRGMAEGVVVMVCPVILALALDKIDSKAFRHGAFHGMLTMACLTLISGICPVLLCSFSQRFPRVRCVRPAPMTSILAFFFSSCLLVLACLIAQLIVSNKTLIAVSVLSGLLVLGPLVCYYCQQKSTDYQSSELHSILDESHEFLTGLTGILFLGLEGLALESHDNSKFQNGTGAVGTISLIVCALGVCLMFHEMIPSVPFNEPAIVVFTLVLDFLMAGGTIVLLTKVMFNLMKIPGLFILTPAFGILIELICRVASERRQDVIIQGNPVVQVPTPASLELTRVTFTGFLAVSITTIKNTSADSDKNNTSPSKLTFGFLVFAGAAIVSGISWRLLTQSQIRMRLENSRPLFKASPAQVASSANLASLCTHFSIVIATILFLAMAWSK